MGKTKKRLVRAAKQWRETIENMDTFDDDFHKGIAYGMRDMLGDMVNQRILSDADAFGEEE